MNIFTLTLSPAFDVHCIGEKIEKGRENFVTLTDRSVGGKGINISRALAAFGIESTAVVVMGEENSEELLNMLSGSALRIEAINVPGRIRENLTVHTPDGDETRISFPSPRLPESVLQKIEKITDGVLLAGDILTLTGSVPEGIDKCKLKSYVNSLAEKGVRVIVDSRSFSLADIVDMKPYLIKPNEYEIREYMGREILDERDALLSAERLRALGIANVMITLGERGAALASSDGGLFLKSPVINAVSTVGAGDSAIAGFIYSQTRGYGLEKTLWTAIAFGAAACLKSGTVPPSPKDVATILENGSFLTRT